MTALVRRYMALAALTLALIGCTKNSSVTSHIVTNHIKKQLRSGATQVEVASVNDFPWDRMFIFAPYQPKDWICETVKVPEPQCSRAGIRDVDEGEFLLVFMQGSQVTNIEYFPRTADFDESNRCMGKAIVRSEALFKVERNILTCR